MDSVGNGQVTISTLVEGIHGAFYNNPPKSAAQVVEVPKKEFQLPNVDNELEAKLKASSKDELAKLSDDPEALKNFVFSTNAYKAIRDEINQKQKAVIALAKKNIEAAAELAKLREEYQAIYESYQHDMEEAKKQSQITQSKLEVFVYPEKKE
jgi:hypothetical protein